MDLGKEYDDPVSEFRQKVKNNGIDSTDLSSIVAVYNSRGKIDYGKDIYRDFSENLYDTDKHIRSSVISPYGCMEESLRKASKDVLGIVM